ncbi:hypothetical protein EXIGLDRAFT_647560 [Exidia glandulosa HHB12029]|uniref:Uncharacterized protein n=1 Tax=Exidia glandulosa HHB12029 TaxID=1314781 RepID=A0A165HLV9_EXIGL|nr:hypothetical protein EXIGLDRAFT_647560 [Exidia glandulosa HHB12029]
MPLARGVLNLPGITPQSRAYAQELLDRDFREHHCRYGPGFHNHLPHFLLAAYDLGAPPSVLNAIYAKDAKDLRPFELEGSNDLKVDRSNWKTHLGDEKAYAAYVAFFTNEVQSNGVAATIKAFVFSLSANEGEAKMLLRLIAGAAHPLIQIGYGLEFDNASLVISGLAQTAIHSDVIPELYTDILRDPSAPFLSSSTPSLSLFAVLREFYASSVLVPVMPYDPDALLSKRRTDAFGDGSRAAEIVKIASQWTLPPSSPAEFWEEKLEEVLWAVILLLFGTSKPGRKYRLDFFVMHMVTSSIFLPTFFDKVLNGGTAEEGVYKAQLLQAFVRTTFAYLIMRGRPRLDATNIMHATSFPHPPSPTTPQTPKPNDSTVQEEAANPWMAIIASAIHAPEAHLPKTLRTLVYASQKYGLRQVGQVPGALDKDGKEVLPGLAGVDGSLFVRCAGVMMDVLGWVDYGQAEGNWDRSAMGWEDAWKND